MERQTKHRILGVLVIIGLVVLLLPLFQDNKELVTETTLIKTPPFPDQVIQTKEDTFVENNTNLVSPIMDNVSEVPENISQPVPDNNPAINTSASLTTKKTLSEKNPLINNFNSVEHNTATDFVKKSVHIAKLKNNNKNPLTEINSSLKPIITIPKKTTTDDGLLKLKSSVWVVQIGSFKNRENALHMVNQLRQNGYHAFIQKNMAAFGNSTRVLVGPEHTKTTARELANRLQNEMHINGIVVSYKPLTL